MSKNPVSSPAQLRTGDALGCVRFAGILAFSFVLLSSPLLAEDPLPTDPETAKRMLEEKKHELDVNAAKELTIQSDVAELDAERQRLNSRLIETAALIQRSEGQMTAIEGRLSELEEQERIVRGSLAQRHGEIAALLSALQRMGRNPPPVLVTRREDALKMVRSAMLLSSAFPGLRDQALSLGTQLADLQHVMGNIRTEGARLQAETDRLNEARTRLASLMEAKKLTLADRQSQLSSVRTATADISKSVTNLSDLINKLDAAVKEKTSLGRYEEELKRNNVQSASAASSSGPQIITPPPPENAGSGGVAKPVQVSPPVQIASSQNKAMASPSAAPSAAHGPAVAVAAPPSPAPTTANGQKVAMIELAPGSSPLAGANPGRIEPAIPFSDARGKLPLPAQGRRALGFGERTQFGGQSKGIVIETRFSAQVTSPCDGWVVYAGEFRSYGQLLIINAGDGYHVLLAGLSQIDVQPGQFVLTAEPVGTMSGGQKNSTSATPVSGPVLYVELRKDGRPIDPDPWWASGQQKVQG